MLAPSRPAKTVAHSESSVLHVIIVKTEGSTRVPPVFPVPVVVVITVGTFAEGEPMGVGDAFIAFEGASRKFVHQLTPVRTAGDWARGRAVQDAEALRRRTALYNRVCG